MVRMSDVWDRSTRVFADRGAILVTIALLFVWLPQVVQLALSLVTGPAPGAPPAPGSAAALLLVLVGLAVVVLGIVGHLALVAVASDPAMSQRDAIRIGLARFGPYLGLALLLALAGLVLMLPVLAVVLSSFPSLAAIRAGAAPPLPGGAGLFLGVYGLVLFVLLAWIEARILSVLAPVVVNERLGIRSYARAFALTRGLTWRIIGVFLLFVVVAVVSMIAAQAVVGIAFRLALGSGNLAQFLPTAIVTLLLVAFSIAVGVFTAQLYVATRGGGAGAWPAA